MRKKSGNPLLARQKAARHTTSPSTAGLSLPLTVGERRERLVAEVRKILQVFGAV
jgi:hypothetical protein